MHDPDIRDAPRQLVFAFRQFTNLIQNELALARAEMSRNLSRAGVGIAMIGVAALLSLVALNVLASALVAVLAANGVPVWLSALIIGGVMLGIAVILVFLGKSRLDPEALAPKRTIDNVKQDLEKLKEIGNA